MMKNPILHLHNILVLVNILKSFIFKTLSFPQRIYYSFASFQVAIMPSALVMISDYIHFKFNLVFYCNYYLLLVLQVLQVIIHVNAMWFVRSPFLRNPAEHSSISSTLTFIFSTKLHNTLELVRHAKGNKV